MLCGRSPFLGNPNKPVNNANHHPKNNHQHNDDSVASIIRRIKNGEFRMDSDAWKYVSPAAKTITKGLLTVDVKKRTTMEALYTSSWINNSSNGNNSNNNNNTPVSLLTPMLLNDPNSNVIDRSLKQTFNAYHTVARETFHSMSNQHIHCLGGHRSSSVSSSSSSLSSGGSSLSSSGAIRCHNNNDYLQQQQFLQLAVSSSHNLAACSVAAAAVASSTASVSHHAAAAAAAVSIAPLMAEAFTGVSYQLMPTAFYPSSNSSVSITKMGPMTRSRKRKMQDSTSSSSSSPNHLLQPSSVSITPAYHPNVTVTKRERTMQPSEAAPAFPAAASPITNNMQYCATARAVVVTPAALTGSSTTVTSATGLSTAATTCPWTTSNRSVTITID